MALTLSRIDRISRTIPGQVDVALLPPRSSPTAATVWLSGAYADGSTTFVLAGPDADSTGAVVVPASADLWMRETDAPEVDAEKVERIYVIGGSGIAVLPGVPVRSVNGQTGAVVLDAAAVGALADGAGAGGALSGSYPNPGLNVTAVDTSVAANIADGDSSTRAALDPLLAAAGGVSSVNGQAGAVVLDAAAVGAQPAGDYASTQALSDGLATKVNSSTYTAGLATKADAAALALKAPYRAGAFVPPSQPVTVVSTMDSGWTHLDTGAAVHDATIFDTGAGSLKITAPSTVGADKSTARLTFTAQDWSDQAFAFRFRTDDWANIIDGYLLASTSGSFVQFFRVQITPKMARVVNGEWSEVTLTRGDFAFNSGTADWSTVNGLMFQLYSADGTAPSLWIDQFVRYTTPSRPTISFAFDDGFTTTITEAKPAMDRHGFRGSAYVMPTAIGTSAYMTQGQIDTLAAGGWEIGGHGVSDLTTLSLAAAEADVNATKAYLVDRGYKGSDVYAYPLGGQTAALRAMVAKFFSAARGTSTFGQTRGYVNRRNMMTRQLGTGVTVADVQGWVDQAVAGNEWLIITGHKLISPTATPEDFTPANFATVVDYVASSGAQVLPVAEALAAVDTAAQAVTLRAPNGTRYRVTVGNDGALTTTAI